MKIEALLPYLLPDVPGVPDITAVQALRLTAIEFCRDTHAWVEIQDPITLEDGVYEYDLDVMQGSTVIAIKNVWLNDRALLPKTMEEVQLLFPNWQENRSNVPSFYNAVTDPGTIRIFPIPEAPNNVAMTVRCAYMPTLSATTLPDSVVNRYLETLIHGAKSRLMVAPGKGWSNPQLAVFHKTEFDAGVQSAKIDILHDNVQSSIRAKPIRFGS